MSKDYREKIEQHRQSIGTEKQPESRLARSRRPVQKNKKRKNPLMTGLVVVFIFIPLMILIYVWGFYEPQETEVVKVDNNTSLVQVEKNNTVSASINEDKDVAVEESAGKSTNEQKDDNSEQLTQQAEEAAKIAEQQAKAEEYTKQQKALEEQRKAEEEQSSGQTVHTVQPNENLYRIALKYFGGDQSGVQKIKDANNLSSDSISVGQQLMIPE